MMCKCCIDNMYYNVNVIHIFNGNYVICINDVYYVNVVILVFNVIHIIPINHIIHKLVLTV